MTSDSRLAASPRVSVLSWCLLLVAACSGGGGGSPDASASRIRPDAIRLAYEQNNLLDRPYRIIDVAREGTRIAAVISHTSQSWDVTNSDPLGPDYNVTIPGDVQFHIHVSEDLGKTWAEKTIAALAPQNGPMPVDAFVEGIHIAGSRGTLVWYVTDNDSHWYEYSDFDIETGAAIPNPAFPTGLAKAYATPRAFGPFLAAAGFMGNYWYHETYDLATGTYSFQKTIVSGIVDLFQMISGDGLVWYWEKGGSSPGEICELRWQPATETAPTTSCATPPSNASHGSSGIMVASAGPIMVGGTNWGSFAGRFDQWPRVYTDLGPGTYTQSYQLHQRTGVLIPLQGGSRLVDLLPSGTAEYVDLPATPCDGDCPDFLVERQWVQPLGDDEYLMLYIVEDSEVFTGHHVYALRSHGTRRPDVRVDDVNPFAAGLEASRLVQMCLSAHRCHGVEVDTCMYHWVTFVPSGSPAASAFVAAALDDCSVFDTTWPDIAMVGSSPCTPGCRDNIAVSCNGEKIAVATDCTPYGTTCLDGYCGNDPSFQSNCAPGDVAHRYNGEAQVEINCPAFGLVCDSNGGCAVAGCTWSCEGNMATTCRDTKASPRFDCTLQEATCQMGCENCPATCVRDSTSQQCYDQCDGPYAMRCGQGWIDCRKIGGPSSFCNLDRAMKAFCP